jgi:hypothetical protein
MHDGTREPRWEGNREVRPEKLRFPRTRDGVKLLSGG